MFKAGQKVVFLGAKCINSERQKWQIYPPENSVVKLLFNKPNDHDFWVIDGYKYTKDGELAYYHYLCFAPLEDWENQDISELTGVIKNPRLTPTTYV